MTTQADPDRKERSDSPTRETVPTVREVGLSGELLKRDLVGRALNRFHRDLTVPLSHGLPFERAHVYVPGVAQARGTPEKRSEMHELQKEAMRLEKILVQS